MQEKEEIEKAIRRLSIYELRNIARIINIEKPALKSRTELIEAISSHDLRFKNKLELALFLINYVTY